MKKIYLRIILLALIFTAGCGKDFLDPYDELVLTVPEFYADLDASSIESITASMYTGNWFNLLDKATTCLELYCGNSFTTDPVYASFMIGAISNSYGNLRLLWTTNYGIIKNCNENLTGFIASLQEGEKLSEKVADDAELERAVNTTIGEMRFFRAICYFNLVKWFGPVPLIYDNIYQMQYPETLTPVVEEDIYEFIIRDLEDAIDKLPADRNMAQSNKLSKISAKALLAKVYLTQAGMSFGTADDFDMAADLADDIITDPHGYALMSTYHELFNPQKYTVTDFPEECLWGWSWSWTALFARYGYNNTLQAYYAPSHFTQSWDGWGGICPTIDLKASFEEGDLRCYTTIMEGGNKYPEFWTEYTFPGETEPGYVYYDGSCSWGGPTLTTMTPRKHLAGRDNSADGHIGEMHTELYTPIIRLADLYLTYAEAILGKNSSTSDAKALNYFNTIRTRAGLDPKTSLTYNDIWNERRHEFAFEFCNCDDLFRYHNLYPAEAANILLSQERGSYICETEPFTIDGVEQEFPEGQPLKVVTSRELISYKLPAVTEDYFHFPIPLTEINGNAYINEPPMRFDFTNYQ